MWRKKARQSLVTIELAQAPSNGEGVVLVACPVFLRELLIPQSRVDFRDGRGLRGNVPTIERPEVQPAAKMLAQIQQPGKAGVSGAGPRARHIEVENRFCLAGANFRKTPPTGIAAAGRAISADSVANKADIHILVRRPVLLEVGKKLRPEKRQVVALKIFQGKREAVIDTDQGSLTPESCATSQSAISRRVQYLRGLGGGGLPPGR